MRFMDTLLLAEQVKSNSGLSYNFSLGPFGLAIGLALLILSIYAKDKRMGIMSSPFLSPYIVIASYAAPLVALADRPRLFIVAWLIT